MHCGIKPSGNPDLALVATENRAPVAAAGVFTQNLACAGPVQVSKAHLTTTSGRASAVIVNSGNANCATGNDVEVARYMCAVAAHELGCRQEHVLVCSTGLIGIPLDVRPVQRGVPSLVAALANDWGGGAARAIMTTDTVPKEVSVRREGWSIGGMAKGAAMLAPNMATMLAVLTTDAEASPEVLRDILRAGVMDSFNAMSVDGCTSTNDTVVLLASGRAGAVDAGELAAAVAAACADLARQMCGDAEGATKTVEVHVVGAADDDEARAAARKVAESQLCKCSWYGEDPYWGRLASELGSAGIAFEPDEVSIGYGGVVVAERGVAVAHDEGALAAHMAEPHLDIRCDLGLGTGSAVILTNDLSHAYIDENMRTS